MRILYVHYMDPESARGGMGVHIHSSTEALEQLGHDVLVLAKPETANATAPSGPVVDRRSRTRRSIAKYGYEPRALLRCPTRVPRELAIARDFKPDVAVVRYEAFEYQMWIICALLGIPLVVEVNGTSRELTRWRSDQVYMYPLTHVLERSVLRRADRVFTVSGTLKRMLVDDGVDGDRIAVIPNGADPLKFRPDIDGQPVRDRYGLGRAPVIGYLGSFGKWHDIEIMADVFPRIAAEHPQVRFLLAGANLHDLPSSSQQKLSAIGDRVVCTGVVPLADAPAHIAAMDVALTVYPAIRDFHMSAIKLFEYMAAGKAIVATAIGQQAEVVDDGVTGLLVAPGDRAAMTQALDRLVREPELRARLGAAARTRAVANHTWRHNAQQIADLCDAAIRQRSGTTPAVAAAQRTETQRG